MRKTGAGQGRRGRGRRSGRCRRERRDGIRHSERPRPGGGRDGEEEGWCEEAARSRTRFCSLLAKSLSVASVPLINSVEIIIKKEIFLIGKWFAYQIQILTGNLDPSFCAKLFLFRTNLDGTIDGVEDGKRATLHSSSRPLSWAENKARPTLVHPSASDKLLRTFS